MKKDLKERNIQKGKKGKGGLRVSLSKKRTAQRAGRWMNGTAIALTLDWTPVGQGGMSKACLANNCQKGEGRGINGSMQLRLTGESKICQVKRKSAQGKNVVRAVLGYQIQEIGQTGSIQGAKTITGYIAIKG